MAHEQRGVRVACNKVGYREQRANLLQNRADMIYMSRWIRAQCNETEITGCCNVFMIDCYRTDSVLELCLQALKNTPERHLVIEIVSRVRLLFRIEASI